MNTDHGVRTHSSSRKGGDRLDALLPVVILLVVLDTAVVITACLEEVRGWLLDRLHGLESVRLENAVAREERRRRNDTHFVVLLFSPEDSWDGIQECMLGRISRRLECRLSDEAEEQGAGVRPLAWSLESPPCAFLVTARAIR